MRPFREVLERYDALWEQAEGFIEAYFSRHRHTTPLPVSSRRAPREDPRSTPTAVDVPDLKELNVAITILKRIQDARRAIQLDAMKMEAQLNDDGRSLEDDDGKISRILRRLEENGDLCAEDEMDQDAV
ncbi:hypothetical protein JW916_00550 [Candidatus Sumerlaeota bacterium]|nr:hypothetical protein [Candidatus Sumerlaeota bacterium]